MEIPLRPEAARDLTFQSYEPAPPLAGVVSVPLRKFRSLEGWFMELVRLDAGGVDLPGLAEPFQVRQVSLSHAAPGRINAFHLHPLRVQDEVWCVLQGDLLVWLVDVRQDSPTSGARSRHHLSGEQPSLLHIPSGVAHGYRAGPQGATLVYAVNSQFDAAHPNEGRLPWDSFGADLWAEDRG